MILMVAICDACGTRLEGKVADSRALRREQAKLGWSFGRYIGPCRRSFDFCPECVANGKGKIYAGAIRERASEAK
jgi:hypothetical protein